MADLESADAILKEGFEDQKKVRKIRERHEERIKSLKKLSRQRASKK